MHCDVMSFKLSKAKQFRFWGVAEYLKLNGLVGVLKQDSNITINGMPHFG